MEKGVQEYILHLKDTLTEIKYLCDLEEDCTNGCVFCTKINKGIPHCMFNDLPYKWEIDKIKIN